MKFVEQLTSFGHCALNASISNTYAPSIKNALYDKAYSIPQRKWVRLGLCDWIYSVYWGHLQHFMLCFCCFTIKLDIRLFNQPSSRSPLTAR